MQTLPTGIKQLICMCMNNQCEMSQQICGTNTNAAANQIMKQDLTRIGVLIIYNYQTNMMHTYTYTHKRAHARKQTM